MKAFDRMAAAVIALVILIAASFNIYCLRENGGGGRQYRVDAARAAAAIEAGENPDPDDYPSLTGITRIEDAGSLTECGSDYLVLSAGGNLYRFDYETRAGGNKTLAAADIALGAMAAAVLAALFIVRSTVIKPFARLREVPYELSRGNISGTSLSVPLKESRQRYFGRFVWGLNMLRDRLEQTEKQELSLRSENKKQIISLSHDIKIPLSAIKLYAKGLEKGIYGPGQQAEAAVKISGHADEIERYVSKIVETSCDDIITPDVRDGEFYLSGPVERIRRYYTDALAPSGTGFTVENYTDCLLRGDPDRLAEVLQNIIENAIKYGDGVSIGISFSDEEDCRLISVSNTGCSLPRDELPHIFDSFYRGSNAGGKEGSGLGLYICRTLMRKMNGDIYADTRGGVMNVVAVCRKA